MVLSLTENHICGFLADHDTRRVGIGIDDMRHDRRIRDAQVLHAMHLQSIIDHRHAIIAHFAAASWMINCRGEFADEVNEIGVRHDIFAGQKLGRCDSASWRMRRRISRPSLTPSSRDGDIIIVAEAS